jgi:hypothetical protein
MLWEAYSRRKPWAGMEKDAIITKVLSGKRPNMEYIEQAKSELIKPPEITSIKIGEDIFEVAIEDHDNKFPFCETSVHKAVSLMNDCWKTNPEERIEIENIIKRLRKF